VTLAADHQGLAPSFCHQLHLRRLVPAAGPIEVSELADMVHFKVRPGFADLATLGEEPMDQLILLRAGHDRPLVGEDCRALSREWYAAEAGDQRFPPLVAWDGNSQVGARPFRCSTVLLYFRAILVTVDRCFPANVFSNEVSITQWSLPRRNTSWARR
jgi:hypothetical protein